MPKPITGFVDRFQNNRKADRAHKYNEAQVRQEFIDPMHLAKAKYLN